MPSTQKNVIRDSTLSVGGDLDLGDKYYVTQYGEEEVPWRLLIGLVDRILQDSSIVDALQEKPLLSCVLYGEDEHLPDLYIDRLKSFTLNRLFPLAGATRIIHFKFPVDYKEFADLEQKVRSNLRTRGYRNGFLSNLPAEGEGHLILESTISYEHFKRKNKQILHDFSRLWEQERIALGKAKVLSVLRIQLAPIRSFFTKYRTRKKNEQIRAIIQAWNQESPQANCLPELGPITGGDIHEWFRSEEFEASALNNLGSKYRDEVLRLFRGNATVSLKELEYFAMALHQKLKS